VPTIGGTDTVHPHHDSKTEETMTEKTWKRRVLTVPLIHGDGRPVKELQGSFEESGQEQSDEHHRRDAEEKTAAEVRARDKVIARRLATLEEASPPPLPEWSAPVDTDGGNVGGNVKRTREQPPARKGREGDSQPSYRVRVRGDTVGKGD